MVEMVVEYIDNWLYKQYFDYDSDDDQYFMIF